MSGLCKNVHVCSILFRLIIILLSVLAIKLISKVKNYLWHRQIRKKRPTNKTAWNLRRMNVRSMSTLTN